MQEKKLCYCYLIRRLDANYLTRGDFFFFWGGVDYVFFLLLLLFFFVNLYLKSWTKKMPSWRTGKDWSLWNRKWSRRVCVCVFLCSVSLCVRLCGRAHRFNCRVSGSWVIQGITETEVCVVFEFCRYHFQECWPQRFSVSDTQKIKYMKWLPGAEANYTSKFIATSLQPPLLLSWRSGVWWISVHTRRIIHCDTCLACVQICISLASPSPSSYSLPPSLS